MGIILSHSIVCVLHFPARGYGCVCDNGRVRGFSWALSLRLVLLGARGRPGANVLPRHNHNRWPVVLRTISVLYIQLLSDVRAGVGSNASQPDAPHLTQDIYRSWPTSLHVCSRTFQRKRETREVYRYVPQGAH